MTVIWSGPEMGHRYEVRFGTRRTLAKSFKGRRAALRYARAMARLWDNVTVVEVEK